ncbi:MAG: 4-amino-4-deoxy-L-arabinose transferase and related glycosyltransferase of family [Chthonomonadales bacterium]|nr:4-amino-4-deoxy-L-arabinose transferase and related glycosyltransferase of family [Chthonomonadales bacterium]
MKESRNGKVAGDEAMTTSDIGSVQPKDAWRFALPVLLLLYLAFAGMHAALVPTGKTGFQNAPDEAAHVVFVRSVASLHLPTHDHPTPFSHTPMPNGYEWHQPPLYYLLAAPFLLLGEQGIRLFSILCGLFALLLIHRTARLLFPSDRVLALLAVGIAALTPTHIAITSTVNNDVLLEVCFSASLFLLIGALLNGFTQRSALWLGLTLGAAILTKATGLLLLPVFGFALLLMWRSGGSLKELLRNAGMTLGIALLISGWWFVRNQMLYGQPMPLRLFAAEFGGTVQAAAVADKAGGWGAYYQLAGLWTFFSFWAVYGTAKSSLDGRPVFLPQEIYLMLVLPCLCATAGMVRVHLQRKTLFITSQLQSLWVCFLTIALVGMSYLAFISKYFQMQGRYLFPAMLPITLVFAMSFRGLFPERWKNPASAILLGLVGVTALAFLLYAMP